MTPTERLHPAMLLAMMFVVGLCALDHALIQWNQPAITISMVVAVGASAMLHCVMTRPHLLRRRVAGW